MKELRKINEKLKKTWSGRSEKTVANMRIFWTVPENPWATLIMPKTNNV